VERFEIADFVEIESFETVIALNDFKEIVVFAVDATELEMFECGWNVFEELERDSTGLDASGNSHDIGVSSGEGLGHADSPLKPALIYELLEVSRFAENCTVNYFTVIVGAPEISTCQTQRQYLTE